MCHAVTNVRGNAAACTKSMSGGIDTRFWAGTFTYSAYPPACVRYPRTS
jgi:hypothetical protein